MNTPIQLRLADGIPVHLNPTKDPELEQYLHDPKSQVKEMIRQINVVKYYDFMFPKEGLTFLDLGANLGLVSLFAVPRCKLIVAVECNPKVYQMMTKLMALSPNVIPVHAAVASKTGTVLLSDNQKDYTCSTLTNPTPDDPRIPVPSLTLADLLQGTKLVHGIDVCKVDIEGAEMELLTVDSIRAMNVKLWYVEVHKTPNQDRDQSLADMISRMQQAGFKTACPRPNAIIARRN